MDDEFPTIPDIKILKKLKQTKSSIVWLGKETNHENFSNTQSQYLIIKGISKSSLIGNSTDFEMLKRERNFLEENSKILSQDCPFPKFIRSYKDDNYLYMIITFIEGLDFSTLILDKIFCFNKFESEEDFKIKKKIFLHLVAQAINIISILHDRGNIYRDFKMNNLLIDKKLKLSLVDFGTIEKLNSADDRTSTVCGTFHIMAPEIFKVKYGEMSSYNSKVDVYSLGVFVYELFCSYPPFDYLKENDETSVKKYAELVCEGLKDDINFSQDFYKKIGGNFYDSFSIDTSKEIDCFLGNVVNLIKLCMDLHPDQRPSIELLKNHHLFEDKFEFYLDSDKINFLNDYVVMIVKYIDFNGEFIECYERLEKVGDIFSNFF
jgi:serine/threonine protein kinase